MKVYILDDNGQHVYDENHDYRFVEIVPCEDCRKFQWSEEDKKAIDKAVNLVYVLAYYNFSLFVERGGSYGRSDMRYERLLGELVNPTRELSEYDSHLIELLLGVMELAAFAGTSDIDLQHLINVYRMTKRFIAHIHNDHREKYREKQLVALPSPLDGPPKEAMVPIAPSHWFRTDYPDWLGLEQLFYFLPDIRGKSQEQINECLQKKEWNGLPRCKTCQRILGFYDQEEKNGSCYGCNLSASSPGDGQAGHNKKQDI